MNGTLAVLVMAAGGMAAALLSGAWLNNQTGKAFANPPAVAAPSNAMPAAGPHVVAASPVEAGRYLVKIAGCNDCHTPGYIMANGAVPEANWLTGDSVGFRGPWGTSYPSNLRRTTAAMSADDFVKIMRERNTRPPMPWTSLHAMGEQDLRSLYAYIKSLGEAGQPAPEWVPPTEEPRTPYIPFTPVFPKGMEPPAPPAAK
jgi:mono/diheme cytochrome c family protein